MARTNASRDTVGELTRLFRQMVSTAERLHDQVGKLAAASEAFAASMDKLQSKFVDAAVLVPSLAPEDRAELLLMARAVPLREGLVELLESVARNGGSRPDDSAAEATGDNLTPWPQNTNLGS